MAIDEYPLDPMEDQPFYQGDIVTSATTSDEDRGDLRVEYCYRMGGIEAVYIRGISLKDGHEIHDWFAWRFELVKRGFMGAAADAIRSDGAKG